MKLYGKLSGVNVKYFDMLKAKKQFLQLSLGWIYNVDIFKISLELIVNI